MVGNNWQNKYSVHLECIIDHFTPTKITKTNNPYHTKYCGVRGTTGPPKHRWWECNMAVSSKVTHTVLTPSNSS